MPLTRREVLQCGTATLAGSICAHHPLMHADDGARPVERRPVAAVLTMYGHNSHADVILTKILEGWRHDGGPGPALKLSAMYVDQFPQGDLARDLSRKHGVPIFESIEKAVTVGGNSIPVDGVLSIGEHGDYPKNRIGQQLYPRRRFFREITDAFEKYGRVVPVFNDKHLGPVWNDAKWMYDRAAKMTIPFMAGSSLPVTYRSHPLDIPLGSAIESAVVIGHSGIERYGFHALECFQALVERRRKAETGVKWVRCLEGRTLWQAVDDGLVESDLIEAAYQVVPKGKKTIRDERQVALFLFEYTDGFRGAVFMLPGTRLTGAAVKLKDDRQPLVTRFEERSQPRYPHFAFLLKAIEAMIHAGRPTYPVERTLLTSGILDRALTSRSMGGKQLETPELAIAYQPANYPHAPSPDLLSPPLSTVR